MSTLKKTMAIMAGILLGLVLLVFSGVRCLETDRVQAMLKTTINGQVPGNVAWKRLRIFFLDGRIEVDKFQLQGPDKKQVIGLERLSVTIAWLKLFNGEISVSSILIDSPTVTLETQDDGTLNLVNAVHIPKKPPEKSETPSRAFPFNVKVDTLVLTDGAGRYSLLGQTQIASVSGMVLRIKDLDFKEKKAVITVDIGSGSVNTPEGTAQIEHFKTGFVVEKGSVSSLSLDLGAGGTKVGVRGSIRDIFKTPVLDMVGDAQIAMHGISQFFPNKPALSGTGHLHVRVKGRIDNPDIQIRAGCGPSVLQGQPVDKIDLDLVLKDRRVRLVSSSVATPFGHFSLNGDLDLSRVFPRGFLSQQKNFDALSYTFFLEQTGTRLSAVLPDLPGVSGRLVSRIRLNGRGIDPERLKAGLDLDLSIKQFKATADGPVDLDIKADLGVADKIVMLNSLTAVSQGIHLSGKTRFETTSGNLIGRLDLGVDDLGLIPGLSQVQGTGTVTASALIAGSYLSPEIKLDLKSDRLGIKGVRLDNLGVKAMLEKDGRVFIDHLTLENQGSQISATGGADLFDARFKLKENFPMDIRFSFKDVRMSDFSTMAGLDGYFSGTGHISGHRLDPVAEVNMSGKKLAHPPYTLGNASLSLNFSEKTLFIKDLRLTNKGSLFAARGRANLVNPDFSLMADPEFQVSITDGGLGLADFSDRMAGRLSISGGIRKTRAGLSGAIDMAGTDLTLDGQKIDRFSLKTLVQDQVLHIKDLDIQVTPKAAVTGQGRVSFADKQMDLGLSSQKFELTALDFFNSSALTGGKMDMALSCRGSIENPVVKSQVRISDVKIKNTPLDDMDVSLEIKDRVARAEGRMGARIKGEFHFEDKTFLASVDMPGFDLSAYFKAAGQDEFSGRVNGTLSANGRLDELGTLQAEADLNNVILGFKTDEIVRIPDLKLTLANNQFKLSKAKIMLLGKEGLFIEGSGSLNRDILVELNGTMPFQAMAPMVDPISDLTGSMGVTAVLRGPISDPGLFADLTLERLGMRIPGMGQKFNRIDSRIRITPEAIAIDHFSGQLGEGRFDLSGTIGLAGLKPDTYDLEVTGQQLLLAFPDTMDMVLNTRLSLVGNQDRSDLKGEIVLLEGRYARDLKLDLARAVEKKREVQPARNKTGTAFFDKMVLDIDIRQRDPFWVDNNLALLSISSDLKLSGTGAAPLVAGRAQVDSGTVLFQKNEFEVRKGVIDFINPYRIEPSIDLEADLEVRSWTIYLIVSGTPDNLDFKFMSTPEEQHADILSLLAFGKTTRELRQADNGTVFSPDQILAGFLAETLEKNIKAASGMDYLEINPGSNGNAGGPGVNVVVGKDLSRQMTVKYGLDVRNGETVQRMITDYKVLENFLMRGFQDTGGHFGGEIKYRLEFR